MKLFYSPGACSLSPHIVLNELGLKCDLVKVDLATKKMATGDFNKINPKGYVPALMLDNDELLTEGVAIMQYLADQKPESKLIPKAGTWDRYRAIEWLNYISTEVHKNFSMLFHKEAVKDAAAKEELRAFVLKNLDKRLSFVSDALKSNQFLMGSQFTVADAYLFTILTWHKWTGVDLTKWPALMGYMERIQTRPSVMKAFEDEKK
jgi:glutathione S-transferase